MYVCLKKHGDNKMTNEEEELIDEVKIELVGEWEPMAYNEFTIGLLYRKKVR